MTDSEWLAMATEFVVALGDWDDVCVERRMQPDGSSLWAVTQGGFSLSKTGRWELTPRPSDTTDAWYEAHRWATKEEALAAWQTAKG